MSWAFPVMVAKISFTFVLAFLYWYIFSQYHEHYIRLWAFSWTFYSLASLLELMHFRRDFTLEVQGHQALMLLSGFLLLRGTYAFLGRSVAKWMAFVILMDAIWIVLVMSVALGMLTVYFDKTRNELAVSEQLFLLLLENANDLIYRYRITPPGFDYISREASTITGYSPAEFYDDPELFFKIVHPDDVPVLKSILQPSTRGNTDTVLRLMHKDGSVTWTEQHSVPVFAESGSIIAVQGIAHDITERKRADLALKESEERYRSFVELSPDMTFVQQDGNYVYMNPAGVKLLGAKSAEELLGQPVLNFVHPEHREIVKVRMRQLLELSKQVPLIEEQMVRVDGKIVFCEVTAAPIMYRGRQAVQVVARDITKRKRAEEALRASEEKYRQLFHYANDMITLCRLTESGLPGQYIEVNDVACRILGYSRDEFMTMTPKDIDDIQSWEKVPQIMETVVQHGNNTFEMCLVSKYGERIPTEINSHAFSLNGEKVILSIARDITSRKRRQEELRETNEKLNAIIQASPLAIIAVDQTGIVRSWNTSAESIFGWKAYEVVGCQCPIALTGNHGELNEKYKPRLGDKVTNMEALRKTKDGRLIDVSISASPLRDRRGIAVGVMAMVEDITNRKRAEVEILESRKKAEQAIKMASLGALAAGISHEINQPLNALKVISDSMIYWHNKGKELKTDKVIENLHKISAQVGRISDIISNIRSIIKKDDSMEKTPCNLNDTVNEALSLLKHQLSLCSIGIHKELAEPLPLIMGRKSVLEEIVINLILNAMQAFDASTEENKEITCTTTVEESVTLEISDTATGVNEGQKDKLFEPFFTTKNGEAMGMGLFIVHSMVTDMNGTIQVRNNQKGGATFRLEFPII